MNPVEYSAHSPRVSDADRERALDVLRENVVAGRVSQDTFVRRVERVLAAAHLAELQDVLRDLPQHDPLPEERGWLMTTITRIAAFNGRMRRAWQSKRLPQLVLPAPGPLPLSIGRASGSGLRLNHGSVSRRHAQLRGSASGWTLRDLGSANGTWVNGCRVTDAVRVRPGDQVSFGAVSFLLAPRRED